MRFTFTLCFLAFLFTHFSYGQNGNSCANAQPINLSQGWSTLQGGSQSTAYYRFQATTCGYLYICTSGTTGDVASDCSGGRFSRQNYQSTCANGGQILLYRMEEQTSYFLRVQAGRSADFSFIPNDFACVCNSEFSDCDQVSATPQTPTQNRNEYSCQINVAFNGNTSQFAYWELNGQRQQTTSSTANLTANQEGNTLVCATYICNGSEYKCCQQVVCPPAENTANRNVAGCTGFNRWADILRQPWFVGTPTDRGVLAERYCGQSIQFDIRSDGSNSVIAAILATGTTEYLSCEGELLASCNSGGCSPSSFNPNQYTNSISSSQSEGARPLQGPQCDSSNPPSRSVEVECNEENFDAYSNRARIAEQSDRWITWREGFEGAESDAYLFKGVTSENGFLYVIDENPNGNGAHDVVYVLGEERTGVHHLSMRVFVSAGYTSYFNIQSSSRRLRGGGIWKMIVDTNGQAVISVGRQTHANFGFPSNQWVDILMQIDLENRAISSFVMQDGRLINNQTISYPEPIYLGGINFYAYEGARFWVDDINVECPGSAEFFTSNANISRSKRPSKASKETMSKPDADKTPFSGSNAKKPVPNLSAEGAPGGSSRPTLKQRNPPKRGSRTKLQNRSQKIKN